MTDLFKAQSIAIASHKAPELSIVVPFFNEATVLPVSLKRLLAVTEVLPVSSEILFVDDGSEDGSASLLAKLAGGHRHIKIIRLSRNFGKEAAMTAGLEHSRGNAVIVLDADMQDPPELIPQMLAQWQQGADVVLMRRRSRAGESRAKRASAFLFYRLLNRISQHEIPADVGDFRLISRRAVDALMLLPERNRYMKGLFAWIGMKTTVIEYDRAPRAAGISRWDYMGLIRLAIEGITSFSISPLHWSTIVGAGAAALGGVYGLWIVLKALILGDAVDGYPSLIAVITFLGGFQLLTIGILGEYVGKTYLEAKQRPSYLIQEILIPAATRKAETHSAIYGKGASLE